MQLTFSTLVCPAWDLRQVIDAAVEYEIPGIDFRGLGREIDVTRLPQFQSHLDQTKALLAEAKLVLPCYCTSVTLVSPSAERWEAMLEECQRYARLAAGTNTRYIRIFGGAVPKEMTHEEARSMARRHLRQLVKVCGPHKCMPLVETHDVWRRSEQVMELLHELQPEEAGVLWDCEHPWRRGESPEQTVRGLGKFLKHVHVKDTTPADAEGKHKQMLLGEGEVPLDECLKALRDAKWDGWICLETEKRWDAWAPEPEVSLPQFVKYMRERLG